MKRRGWVVVDENEYNWNSPVIPGVILLCEKFQEAVLVCLPFYLYVYYESARR